MKKNKICVYTCITGNYDNIHEIKNKEKGIDYYCYTNNKNVKSKTWKVKYIEDDSLTNLQLARKIKILGTKELNEYETLVWIDGAVSFNKSIRDFMNTYCPEDSVFAAFKHSARDNIKEECFACIRARKETKEKVKKLLEFYEKEKYTFNNGLIESTVYIKKPKNKIVQKTMKLWFDMIMKYTCRDQLSFNYCIKKTGLKVNWIEDIAVFNNKWFDWYNHKYEDIISEYRLYFGNEKDYKYDNDIYGEYIINGNIYRIETTVPEDTDKMTLDVSHLPCTFLKSVKVNGKKVDNITYFNHMMYDDKVLFYTEYPILEINQKVKKDTPLVIELEMDRMELSEIYKLVNDLKKTEVEYNEIINELSQKNSDLSQELQDIVNSKSWRFLDKVRQITKR